MVGMITAEKYIISGEKEAESVADYGFPCLMDSMCGIHSGGDSFYPCASIPWIVTATGAGAYLFGTSHTVHWYNTNRDFPCIGR
jgi:hypothetical protein